MTGKRFLDLCILGAAAMWLWMLDTEREVATWILAFGGGMALAEAMRARRR